MARNIPALPKVRYALEQDLLISAYNNSSVGIHEITERLEELEAHLAGCSSCRDREEKWSLRALLLQKKAECAIAVESYGKQLGWGQN